MSCKKYLSNILYLTSIKFQKVPKNCKALKYYNNSTTSIKIYLKDEILFVRCVCVLVCVCIGVSVCARVCVCESNVIVNLTLKHKSKNNRNPMEKDAGNENIGDTFSSGMGQYNNIFKFQLYKSNHSVSYCNIEG